jgi:hypothetical protein
VQHLRRAHHHEDKGKQSKRAESLADNESTPRHECVGTQLACGLFRQRESGSSRALR